MQKLLQRAYITVNLGGIIEARARDGLIGHVEFQNAGHLPARDFLWSIYILVSKDGEQRTFDLPGDPDRGPFVLAPQAKVTRGSKLLPLDDVTKAADQVGDSWIFVFGKITYSDGFEVKRFTQFCHRYKWEMRSAGNIFPAEIGRVHDFANDAS